MAWAAKRRWGATWGLFVLSLGVSLQLHAAQAAGFLIVDGQIAGPQVMTEDGDIGTVEAGGTISSTGPNAVAVTGDDAYVANYGNIFGNGAFADGIDVSGDRAVIDNFGVVRTYDAYADAISVTGADAVVTNRGFIYADGAGSSAIYSTGANAVARNAGTIVIGFGGKGIALYGFGGEASNSGRIEATSSLATGIYGWAPVLLNTGTIVMSIGSNTGMSGIAEAGLVRNAGDIEMSGSSNVGIESRGKGATVENLGRIIIYDGDGIVGYAVDQYLINDGLVEISNSGYGMYGLYSGITIVNRGTLTVSGTLGYGIYSGNDDQTVVNSGTITTNGYNGHGIMVVGEGSSVINSGRISASGTYSSGVTLSDPNATLSNSGYIYSAQDYAVRTRSGNNRLNLLAGSVIDGEVWMEGSGNTVSFGPGLNARVTFTGTLPDTITSSNPMVISGNTVTVLDRGGFVLTEDMVLALAASAGQGRDDGLAACMGSDGAEDCHVTAWLNGVGGLGGRAEQEDLAGLAFAHGGLEAGLDIDLGPVSAGAFASAAAAYGEVGSSQATDIAASIFGGHIGLRQGMMFAQASASYGLLELSGSRELADNTVAGGLLTAEADSTGTFLSPALVAGLDLAMGGMTLTPSLGARYTQLTLSGYAEDGASDDLSVSERMVEELALRAQLALALTPVLTEAGGFAWTLRAGADARRRSGEDIVASLAGTSVQFAGGGNRDSFGGFVGANLDYRLGAATLSSDVELGLDTAGLHSIAARATLAGGF